MAVVDITDPTKWSIQNISSVNLFVAFDDTSTSKQLSAMVIKKESTFSIKPIVASKKSSYGRLRVVGYKLEANILPIINNFHEIQDNLTAWSQGVLIDLDIVIEGIYSISTDVSGIKKTGDIELTIKTNSDGMPQMELKINWLFSVTDFNNIITEV